MRSLGEDLRAIARAAVDPILLEAGLGDPDLLRSPLPQVAELLETTVLRTPDPRHPLRASVAPAPPPRPTPRQMTLFECPETPPPQQLSLFNRPSLIEIHTTEAAARFDLAHELAHVIYDSEIQLDYPVSDDRRRRRLLDYVAALLLFPDALVARHFGAGDRLEPTLEEVLAASQQAAVPWPTMLIRLQEYIRGQEAHLAVALLLVQEAFTPRSRTNYAPRIEVACSPRLWSVPRNRRLTSIGLTNLDVAYRVAGPYLIRSCTDHILLRQRGGKTEERLPAAVDYFIVEATSTRPRRMLARFPIADREPEPTTRQSEPQ